MKPVYVPRNGSRFSSLIAERQPSAFRRGATVPDGIEQIAILSPVTLLPELVNMRGDGQLLGAAGPFVVGPTALRMISAGTKGTHKRSEHTTATGQRSKRENLRLRRHRVRLCRTCASGPGTLPAPVVLHDSSAPCWLQPSKLNTGQRLSSAAHRWQRADRGLRIREQARAPTGRMGFQCGACSALAIQVRSNR